ncbi:MAG: UDP-3-O-acyl-N-acetylglucosamine deacetylase [Candidatus Xenobia bacterium]
MTASTIRRVVELSGTGLHSGASVRVRLRAAAPGRGLRFIRTDLPGTPEIPVSAEAAVENARCTRLQTAEAEVMTPEHLLSACFGLGVTDLDILLDGPELPIADGSAAPFVALLQEAGLASYPDPRTPLRLHEPLWIDGGNGSGLLLRPADRLHLTFVASYPHPLVGTQILEITPDTCDYAREIAPARTFGFIEEVEALRQQGLAQGGSLDCAVVVYPDRYSSPLRFPDELGRHKVLDLMGDLTLLGRPLLAHVTAIKSSHRLHTRLAKALAARMTVSTGFRTEGSPNGQSPMGPTPGPIRPDARALGRS